MKFNKETIATITDLSGGGLVLIENTIIVQVPHVTIDLPEGYLSYKLILNGFRCMESGEDSLNYRFSLDGGVTFPNSNYQYREMWANVDHSVYATGSDDANSNYMADGFPGQTLTTAGISLCGELDIFPGSASLWPSTYFRGVTIIGDAVDIKPMFSVGVYKGVGRATNIRLLVSTGVADFDAGGSYSLFGIPSAGF